MKNAEYSLSLDVGRDHVGYCLMDKNHNVIPISGKKLWGVHTFEDAETAQERRQHRINRRNIDRAKRRLNLLQMLFAEEIHAIDDTFFLRLNESMLYLDDKSTNFKYPLFNDENYTDKDYYKDYPTGYHLRWELINNPAPHDIRLVYLALYSILKHRGNFLTPGSLSEVRDLNLLIDNVLDSINELSDYALRIEEPDKVRDLLQDKKKKKQEKIKDIIPLILHNSSDEKAAKNAIKAISRLMVGGTADVAVIFPDVFSKEDPTNFSFADAKYDEEIYPELDSSYPEYAAAINEMKGVYNWEILNGIVGEEKYLCCAEINIYNKHHDDLALLKRIIKTYCTDGYYEYFFHGDSKKAITYAAYIGTIHDKGKKKTISKCSRDNFLKEIVKLANTLLPEEENANNGEEKKPVKKLDASILRGIPVMPEDIAVIQNMKQDAEHETFLPRIRMSTNGVIPNQLHLQELTAILENARKYLPFLNQADEYGTVADKIQILATFRIPYFVGPLSNRHADQGANVWMVRKKDGKILPWNFSDYVDEKASRNKFIARMTAKCNMIPVEDVLPKESLTYTAFVVLNQLNVLKIKGEPISVDTKKELYRNVYCQHDTVTVKTIYAYLKHKYPELTPEDIGGISIDYKGSLKPYRNFAKILGADKLEDPEYCKIIEKVIQFLTVFHNDSKQIQEIISETFPGKFTVEECKKISHLSYTGWGNLSKEFLNGITGANVDTGECFTIIKGLWDTNNNLQQLMSKQYTFADEVDALNREDFLRNQAITYENTVGNLNIPPSVKRSTWRTIRICEEIHKIVGVAPTRIFIKMHRGAADSNKNESKKETLLKLYKNLLKGKKDIQREWMKEIQELDERLFNNRNVYLYFLQMGRCMYTGKEIPLSEVLDPSNQDWNRDHIYPQSRFIDETIDNLVLVDSSVNRKKGSFLLDTEIRKKMDSFWKKLVDYKLLTKVKYDRLVRSNEFTEEELSSFVAKQIVEQRRSTKVIADILKNIYRNTEVVYVKARLVSLFKQEHDIELSPLVSKTYYAKEAYMTGVVGDLYDAKFTSNPLAWFKSNRQKNYSIRKLFNYDVERDGEIIWFGEKENRSSINKVIKILNRNDILTSEQTYCESGKMFDDNPSPKGKASLIPRKKNLDPLKYGGFSTAATYAFAIITRDANGTRVKDIAEIPIHINNKANGSYKYLETFIEEKKGYKDVKIVAYPVMKNSEIRINGYPMRIRGVSGNSFIFKNALELVLTGKSYETACRVCKFIAKNKKALSERELKKYRPEPSETYDKFNDTDLNELYDDLLYKLTHTIYSKRLNNQADFLAQRRDAFRSMDNLSDKALVINEFMNLFRSNTSTSANFQRLGGVASAGIMQLSAKKLESANLELVNTSITGFYESRRKI